MVQNRFQIRPQLARPGFGAPSGTCWGACDPKALLSAVVSRMLQKEEEVPSEGLTVEPAMWLRRGMTARRSSYAFSHREGYANLITQGTILRRHKHVDEFYGDTACNSPNPSEEDVPWQHKESIFNPRKISILAKKRRQHYGKGSQGEVHPNASSQTTEKQTAINIDNQTSETKKLPTTTSGMSGQLQVSSSEDQAFYSALSHYSLASQPERMDVRSSSRKGPLLRDSASSRSSHLEVPTQQHGHTSS